MELKPIPDDAPRCGQIWTHVRGTSYSILGTGQHTESGELLVMYMCRSSGRMFSRPLSMWHEKVLFHGVMYPRFALLGSCIGKPVVPTKRMRFNLEPTKDTTGDFIDQHELDEMRKLQGALIARGYSVDLYTVHRAWCAASLDHAASFLSCEAREDEVAHVLQHLEEDV